MPVTDVQPSNSGTFTGTSATATLPIGTTAGSTLILVISCGGSTIPTVTGFTNDSPTISATARTYVFRKTMTAGETSWGFTVSLAVPGIWIVFEKDGLDPSFPVDVKQASLANVTSGTAVATGSVAATSYDAWELCLFTGFDSASTTPPILSGFSAGYTEISALTNNNGTASVSSSIVTRDTRQIGAKSCSATSSVALGATRPVASGWIIVYTCLDAQREANIAHFLGFKVGTTAGIATGVAIGVAGTQTRYVETMTGSPAMGANGMTLASTAAAENITTGQLPIAATSLCTVQWFRFRFDGSLPSTNVELVFIDATGSTATLRFIQASSKLGLKLSTGTEVLSDTTVTADTWLTVDVRYIFTSTAHTADWQIDYGLGGGVVAQTTATFTAAGSGTTPNTRLGWTNAITVPGITYQGWLHSNVAGHYPLGASDWSFQLLGPDPAATPTVSGTAANFQTFTANGTLAAWNATTARDNVDDWPPVFGASADGFVAVTASATDYVEVPMTTYDASGIGSIRAVRIVMPIWAASATAATCRIIGWDGTTATTLFAEANPTTDNSATPGWVCKMWRPSGGWTQAKLNAAAIRFGANDATPDVGPHAVGMIVAVQLAKTYRIASAEDDTFTVDGRLDPVSDGVTALVVTAPVGDRGATLEYVLNGSTVTRTVNPGSTLTEPVDAADWPSVSRITIMPDPVAS